MDVYIGLNITDKTSVEHGTSGNYTVFVYVFDYV